ncbi:MAG: hypothetical protein AAF394_09905 [Planctomycetota bacterium]
MHFLAQTAPAVQESIAYEIVRALANNGFWVFLSVVVLAGVLKHVASEFMKHRERVAMIESGINPNSADAVPDASIVQENEIGETVAYQSRRA